VTKVADFGRLLSAPLAPTFPLWLRKLGGDILHFHLPNPTAVVSAFLARPGGRVVVTYHSDIVRQRVTGAMYGPLLRAFLRRADVVIVTSPDYLESSPVLRSVRERCRVIPLGVDPARMEATPAVAKRIEELKETRPGPRVFFLGVLRYYKGLHLLLRAVSKIDCHLYVGGDGPMRPALERQAAEEKLTDRVHFLGALSDEESAAWMHTCDVFCLPAHLRSEAFGLCQVEAQLCGRPVVSTALATGVPYVNLDGVTGLVVPPGSPDALAEALRTLLSDEALRVRLGEQGRSRALREFTASVMTGRLWSLYEEVLGGAPSRQSRRS